MSAKTPRRRLTLGFLTANIHTGVARTLWPGILDAAQQNDVNLLCFPGGGLHIQSEFEAQRNLLYDLVSADNVDGLVSWASTLGVALDHDEVVRFHRRYRPLPIASLTLPMAGIPTIAVNSYDGMRAVILHLLEMHRFRRLAFIRGPESHYYAQERYRAYGDVLQEYGIPLDPRLVTPSMPWNAGAEAIQILLDERQLRPGIDFEAIVSVSDLLALDAMRTLQARGLSVPGNVAVVGFNDSAEGRLATPSLTSVYLPFYEQGHRAVETLLAQLKGQPVPESLTLPSQLVVRQSCGCPSQLVLQATVGLVNASPEPFLSIPSSQRDLILAEMSQNAGTPAGNGLLLDAFISELRGQDVGDFLPTLEKSLSQAARQNDDLTAWQGIISTLRRHTLPHLNAEARQRCEDLCGQARILIGEMAQRLQAYRRLSAERQAETLRVIGQTLATTFDVDKLTDVLAEHLPRLGIASGYLALYEESAAPQTTSRLILAYTERGRVPLEPGGRRFASRQLIPAGLYPQRRYSFVVEPLYFQDKPLGFILLEVGPRDGTVYEILRAQISSALKGALLLREAQQARAAAEKADQIKTRLLANISHELRTPLNIILNYTQEAQRSPNPYGIPLPQALLHDLQQIHHNAEYQLRVINDLLDLSRAEIDELDLYRELLDPHPLLAEAFHNMADPSPGEGVTWRLQLPNRLPLIQVDPVRLRQILLNLLSNARKFTEQGTITLGAEVSPPHLHIWVQDTGIGIPLDEQERIFEPFVTISNDRHARSGIGLGLSITRRLVALHGGSMTLNSQPGQGSTFHVYLPLPDLSDQPHPYPAQAEATLLLIANAGPISPEIAEICQREGLTVQRLQAGDNLDRLLQQTEPIALAWDLAHASPADWTVIRRLRNHPKLCQLPFILYGHELTGAVGFVGKPASSQGLLAAINAISPAKTAGPVLIVDDDPQACSFYTQVIDEGLPGYTTRIAHDGATALQIIAQETPGLVILDLMMPEMDGFEVLDRMRADPRTRQVPVVILSNKLLNLDDIKRLEQHALVTFQSKGLLSEAEIIATLHRALFGADTLPQQTSALVKRAVAYLHQNYARPLTRWEVAAAVGVSEDYLSRVFSRELGLSPWDYLNRYRIYQAKELLRHTHESIKTIARQVGFKDRAYFSRVFHHLTGLSPQAFRTHPNS